MVGELFPKFHVKDSKALEPVDKICFWLLEKSNRADLLKLVFEEPKHADLMVNATAIEFQKEGWDVYLRVFDQGKLPVGFRISRAIGIKLQTVLSGQFLAQLKVLKEVTTFDDKTAMIVLFEQLSGPESEFEPLKKLFDSAGVALVQVVFD
jgi:hypothetical protein